MQALAGIMRHRFAVSNWLSGAYRTVQVVTRKSADLGATLPKNLATGEVVSVGAGDLAYIGNLLEMLGPVRGAIVAFVVVAVILLSTSTTLGLVVLIGVPLMLFALGPMLRAAAPAPVRAARGGRRAELAGLRHRLRACACCAASAARSPSPGGTAPSRSRSVAPA